MAGYNPTQDLTIDPQSFIKSKIANATKLVPSSVPGQTPSLPTQTPVPAKPVVAQPSIKNVSNGLPQVSQQQVQQSVEQHTPTPVAQPMDQQKESYINNTLADLGSDVKAGMPIDQLPVHYSDIPQSIVGDLYTDIKSGMPVGEARKIYPELNQINVGNAYNIPKANTFGQQLDQELSSSDGAHNSVQDYIGDKVKAGLYNTGKGIVQGFAGGVEGAHDLLNRGSNALSQDNAQLPVDQNASVGTDLAKVGIGALNTASAAALPGVAAGLGAVSELPGAKQILDFVGKKAGQGVGLATQYIPGYKDLPENTKKQLDGAVANAIMTVVGGKAKVEDPATLLKAGEKVGDIGNAIKEKIAPAFDVKNLDSVSKKVLDSNSYAKQLSQDLINHLKENQGQGGVDPEALRQGVEQFKQEYKQQFTDTMDSLKKNVDEAGSNYNTVRQYKGQIDANPLYKDYIGDTIAKYDIKVNSDGTYDFRNSKVPENERAKASQALSEIHGLGDMTTVNPLMNTRSNIGRMRSRQDGFSRTKSPFIRDLYQDVSDFTKDSVPGVKKIDEEFAPKRKIIDQIEDVAFNNQGDVYNNIFGKLKEAGVKDSIGIDSKFADAMDSLDPTLRSRGEAIATAEKVAKQYFKTNNPIGLKSLVLKGITGAIFEHIPGLNGPGGYLVGALAEYLFEKGIDKIKQAQIENYLKKLSPEDIQNINVIGQRIKQGGTISTADKKKVDNLGSAIQSLVGEANRKIDMNKIVNSVSRGLPNKDIKGSNPNTIIAPGEKIIGGPNGLQTKNGIYKAPRDTIKLEPLKTKGLPLKK